MSVKDCEYPGCGRQVGGHRLFCGFHWGAVPYALQRAVWATWDARINAVGTPGYPEAVEAHEAAKRDAIVAVRGAVRP